MHTNEEERARGAGASQPQRETSSVNGAGPTPMQKNTKTNTTSPHPVSRLAFSRDAGDPGLAAYQRLEPAMRALSVSDLVSVKVDIAAVDALVRGTVLAIAPLRSALLGAPDVDMAKIDALEDHARALAQANVNWLAARAAIEPLDGMTADAVQRRDVIVAELRALGARGKLAKTLVDGIAVGRGFRAVADSLATAVKVARASWDVISVEGRLTSSELDEAARLADAIRDRLASRAQGDSAVAEAADMRRRAFTLLVQAHDEARRAVTFVRWHQGDADELAPSIYTTRRTRTRGSKKQPDAPPAPSVPPSQTVAPPADPVAPAANG